MKGILISRQADNCCARTWRQFLKSPIWPAVEGFHRSSVLGEADLNKDLFSVGFGLHRLLFRVGGWSLKTNLLVSPVICFFPKGPVSLQAGKLAVQGFICVKWTK